MASAQDSTGVDQDRGMCEEKRKNDRPEEDGTLNSGRRMAPDVGEIYLQRPNDFQPIEGVAKSHQESDLSIVVRDGNSERLWDYAWNAKRLVLKWLNRRSQRRSYNWTTFEEAWERWKIPSPQIYEQPWPQARQTHPQPALNVRPIRVQS